MEKQNHKDKVEAPFTAYGRYTYADYLGWEMEEMVELIRGKVFRQAAAPRVIHQRVAGNVFVAFSIYLKGKKCDVFIAPFDVRLPVKSKKNEDIDTVVQPDICVICDPDKLDEAGCIGAPDLIVEVLSQGNNKKELQNKYDVYEESGVREYWVIHPSECTLVVYTLINGRYDASKIFTHGDRVASQAVAGFVLDLEEVFNDMI
ncbi:MAG: Uma2 family endonuclease [Cyclobacteriaceae bacterium]